MPQGVAEWFSGGSGRAFAIHAIHSFVSACVVLRRLSQQDRACSRASRLRTAVARLACAFLLTAAAAQAGTLVSRTQPAPLHVAEIAVTVDVGYWVAIECGDQAPQESNPATQAPATPAVSSSGAAPESPAIATTTGAPASASPTEVVPVRQTSVDDSGIVRLQQVDHGVYRGCTHLQVRCNFALTLDCAIMSTGAIAGLYTCTLSPGSVEPPGSPPAPLLCVELAEADLTPMHGGSADVHVATVTITVTPR